MKNIVVYASRTGTTEKMAKEVAKHLGAELMKVEPKETYGKFASALTRVAKEKARNEQAASLTPYRDFSGYDNVLIGFPIWAGDVPTYLQDFIQNSTLGGAAVIPFATSAISGIRKADRTIRLLCPGSKVENPFVSNPRTVSRFPAWIRLLELNYRK